MILQLERELDKLRHREFKHPQHNEYFEGDVRAAEDGIIPLLGL
jgi:hypothetical protein